MDQRTELLNIYQDVNDYIKIKAVSSFWLFCRILAPDFYRDSRPHLRRLCNTLQYLYEGKLKDADGNTYKYLMLNMPPRFGKSRTLQLFCEWVLGLNPITKIICCSYNDDMAMDFSRYTRDGIGEDKIYIDDIVYSDIFPNTKLKYGDASFHKWALEGRHFNYKGAGMGAGITGRGGDIIIIDDPVKDAAMAYNDIQLEKDWLWYTGTLMSREEEGHIKIINMSRWAKKDLCGRILESEEADLWFQFVLKAKENGKMLCPELLSKESFNRKEKLADNAIFRANYYQEPVDIKGILYSELKKYPELPRDGKGKVQFEEIIAYGDTADRGDNNLCVICAGKYQKQLWILDVYYTKKGMEVTEPETANFLIRNNVDHAKIESNSGGRGFARNVERILWEKYHNRKIKISWFHQSENKLARILTNANYIMQNVYFPMNWHYRFPDYHNEITGFKKEGGNLFDDGADATTGLVEMIEDRFEIYAIDSFPGSR